MPRHNPQSRHHRSAQVGFTLIEVLVVLVIVGMVSGILFQALAWAYRMQERFGKEMFYAQQVLMIEDWYRQTVQGLYPDYPDGQHIFAGKAQEFSGLTSNPLNENYGALTAIAWHITPQRQAGTIELKYMEGQREITVMQFPADSAHFIYLDAQQIPHESWPPRMGISTQLPKQIQLIVRTHNGTTNNLIATLPGPAIPPARPQDSFGGAP